MLKLSSLLLILISSNLHANTKAHMRKVFDAYIKLVPIMYQGGEKAIPRSANKYLTELENALKNSGHEKLLNSPNLSPSLAIATDAIGNIKKAINIKHYSYSRATYKNLLSACISCHAQLPKDSFKKISHGYKEVIEKNVKKNYDKAMVSLFLRDYETSIKLLKKEVEASLKKEYFYRTEKHLQEILKIYLMNLKDQEGAKEYFTNFYKSLSEKHKKRFYVIQSWSNDLYSWKKSHNGKYTDKEIKKDIQKFLDPLTDELSYGDSTENLVPVYLLQGILSNHAIKNNKSELMPEILYWLGRIENQAHTLYLYSLGDTYLKKCIYHYPKSKIAKKCYKAYADSIRFGFTGSMGTQIPNDIKQELKKLKSLILK